MPGASTRRDGRLKLLLVLEMFFAGFYLPMTAGIFVVYLSWLGYGVESLSTVFLASSLLPALMGYLFLKRPSLVSRRVRAKLLVAHAGERLSWLLVPLVKDPGLIAAIYMAKSVCSVVIGVMLNLVIYASFDEEGVRDVTAKRSSVGAATSIVGHALATLLLAVLPPGYKYLLTFYLGAGIGLVSTAVMAIPDLSHLEGIEVPGEVRGVEEVYSTSLFQLLLTTAMSLLGIAWTPYLINVLGYPDYLATLMSLVGTATSIFASLFWRSRSYGAYRYSLAMQATVPVLILALASPEAQLALAAYNAFTGTGAGFLGSFLFAEYTMRVGAVRTSAILVTLSNLGLVLASIVGMSLGGDYVLALAAVSVASLGALAVAYLTIPQVALVPESAARSYALVLYRTSLTGYRLSVEYSRETVVTTLRLLALTASLMTLYVIYRTLAILIGM